MNAISPWQQGPRVYMRSLATRVFGSEISAALPDVVGACKAAGFDLVIVETSGIGQGDAAIVPHVDVPLYVMTPEFGAASQLEKIDMLDFAQFVAINKFDRKGAADALRDVAKQVQRNKEAFGRRPEEMPVFGTMAARFNDDGVTALFQALKLRLAEIELRLHEGKLPLVKFAELMGGGIAVESTLGKGATFTFWLPVLNAASDVEKTATPEPESLPIVPELLKNTAPVRTDKAAYPIALVIEDNPDLRRFIKQSISDYWQVEEASNGEEGIQQAIELIPDLIISDLMMPVKDGFAVCEALKENELTAHIPIILLTAKANIASRLTGLRSGADDYLTKPFHTEELLVRMESLLNVRIKLRAHYSQLNIGAARTEHAFAVFLNLLGRHTEKLGAANLASGLVKTIRQLEEWANEAGIKKPSIYNFAVTDGENLVTVRYVSNQQIEPISLYFSNRGRCMYREGKFEIVQSDSERSGIVIASERLTDDSTSWTRVAPNHVVIVDSRLDVMVQLLPNVRVS